MPDKIDTHAEQPRDDDLGVPMVYVNHDAAEMLAIADRVIVLDRGQIVLCGEP